MPRPAPKPTKKTCNTAAKATCVTRQRPHAPRRKPSKTPRKAAKAIRSARPAARSARIVRGMSLPPGPSTARSFTGIAASSSTHIQVAQSLSWFLDRESCTALTVPAGAGLCIAGVIGPRVSAGIAVVMSARFAAANSIRWTKIRNAAPSPGRGVFLYRPPPAPPPQKIQIQKASASPGDSVRSTSGISRLAALLTLLRMSRRRRANFLRVASPLLKNCTSISSPLVKNSGARRGARSLN